MIFLNDTTFIILLHSIVYINYYYNYYYVEFVGGIMINLPVVGSL